MPEPPLPEPPLAGPPTARARADAGRRRASALERVEAREVVERVELAEVTEDLGGHDLDRTVRGDLDQRIALGATRRSSARSPARRCRGGAARCASVSSLRPRAARRSRTTERGNASRRWRRSPCAAERLERARPVRSYVETRRAGSPCSASGCARPRLEDAEDEPIGDQTPRGHEVLRAATRDAARSHGLAQQVAGRDVRNTERLAQHFALRPLARPRRSDEEQSHMSGPWVDDRRPVPPQRPFRITHSETRPNTWSGPRSVPVRAIRERPRRLRRMTRPVSSAVGTSGMWPGADGRRSASRACGRSRSRSAARRGAATSRPPVSPPGRRGPPRRRWARDPVTRAGPATGARTSSVGPWSGSEPGGSAGSPRARPPGTRRARSIPSRATCCRPRASRRRPALPGERAARRRRCAPTPGPCGRSARARRRRRGRTAWSERSSGRPFIGPVAMPWAAPRTVRRRPVTPSAATSTPVRERQCVRLLRRVRALRAVGLEPVDEHAAGPAQASALIAAARFPARPASTAAVAGSPSACSSVLAAVNTSSAEHVLRRPPRPS